MNIKQSEFNSIQSIFNTSKNFTSGPGLTKKQTRNMISETIKKVVPLDLGVVDTNVDTNSKYTKTNTKELLL